MKLRLGKHYYIEDDAGEMKEVEWADVSFWSFFKFYFLSKILFNLIVVGGLVLIGLILESMGL